MRLDEILKRDGSRCYYCNVTVYPPRSMEAVNSPDQMATRDHKRPKSRGGSDHPSNIVLCCHGCNRFKDNMTELEFFDYLEMLEMHVED